MLPKKKTPLEERVQVLEKELASTKQALGKTSMDLEVANAEIVSLKEKVSKYDEKEGKANVPFRVSN